MTIILDGKLTAEKIRSKLKKEVTGLKITPHLAVILVGNNPSSEIYVKNKQKYATEIGINSSVIKLKDTITETELINEIKKLNNDKKINGILVQLPLPKQINEFNIINTIAPEKDVDGFTIYNKGLLTIENPQIIPCTPLGIIELLKEYKIDISGKHTVIIGRSNIVGKPLSMLLLQNNATVTICHSYTQNLEKITKTADILISAIGKPNFITKEYIKKDSIIIDVGITKDIKTNKWMGDIDFKNVKDLTKFITPVPGGIGPMTIAMLLKNTIAAYKLQNNIK